MCTLRLGSRRFAALSPKRRATRRRNLERRAHEGQIVALRNVDADAAHAR
jgi:hypothetical protein